MTRLHEHLPTMRRDFHLEIPPDDVRGGVRPTAAEIEDSGGYERREYDLANVDDTIEDVMTEVEQYCGERQTHPERIVVDPDVGEHLFVAVLVIRAEDDPITVSVSAKEDDIHVYGVPITVVPTRTETTLIEACSESNYDAKHTL